MEQSHDRGTSHHLDLSPNNGSGTATTLYVIALILALVALGGGVYLAIIHQGWALLAAGAVSVIGVLAAWPIAAAMSRASTLQQRRQVETTSMISERLQQISVLLNMMSEQQLLSDRAKQVAFRDKDRDALRRAIKEDLSRRDWEAALVLVDDMERTFGYHSEAATFREEINRHREEVVRQQINHGLAQIENYCRQEKWSEALREAERLMRSYPDAKTDRLPAEIENRRQQTKKQLLDAFNAAVSRNDVDGGIAIVRKLDMYLTRQEAESMQESVRNIFKEKLNQLGEQFKILCREKRWGEALRIGESIIRDFPNSGIARDVRETMATLRQNAGETQPELARA